MMPRGMHTRDKYGMKRLKHQETATFDYCEELEERIRRSAYRLNEKYRFKLGVTTFTDQDAKYIIVTNKEPHR